MTERLTPSDGDQLVEAMAWAAAERRPVEILGAGTKRALGRPFQSSATLDLSRLAGIIDYEPSELVLTARAGTPLRDIQAVLAEGRQQLAFEPPNLGPLLGSDAGGATIGGVLACNHSGPRRIQAGAARDHFLGVSAVSGRGEAFKSGGKVVKNVTGYDLCKLLAGSYGTLAALAEVSVKVLPAPEKTRTVLAFGLDDGAAVEMLGKAARTPYEPSGLAHLPEAIAKRSTVSYVAGAGRSVTAIRIEGVAESVAFRCERLQALLAAEAEVEELHSANSAVLWREIGEASWFAADASLPLWRLSVPPAKAAAVVAAVAAGRECTYYFDWAGGLIWLATAPDADAGAAAVRGALPSGHATLIRADADIRAAVPVFQPQPEALAALARGIKNSFDPHGILNPGRMYAEG